MSRKTNKALRKRLKVTGSGKVLHKSSGRRKLLSKKPAKRLLSLRKWRGLADCDRRSIERQYGAL
jgi:ribosomal protein L35